VNASAADTLLPACAALHVRPDQLGVVIVDHGSRRAESNANLLAVVDLFRRSTSYTIVEPAHMELAEPSIATALDRAVQQGARLVVVHPYFLSPGRHWAEDIPGLVQSAAARHPGLRYLVTAPLGVHELMAQIMHQRIVYCLRAATEQEPPCELCDREPRCHVRISGRGEHA
jgi:sirohydrochlorin ferrochelatase